MQPSSDEQAAFGLGPIDQISFAIRDMDEALPRYTAMFGPFVTLDVPGLEVLVHGEPSTTTLRLAFGRSGGIEVELVEVVDGAWPTLSWLEANGEGLHHIRYPVDDLPATSEKMVASGFTVTMESGDRKSYVYLQSPLLNGMTIELLAH